MIKELLWILVVQILLNPFTVFVITGVVFGGQAFGVFFGLVVAFAWGYMWLQIRKQFATLDQRAADIWIYHKK